MALILTQTDTAADDGVSVGCSGAPDGTGTQNAAREATENGSAGSTEATLEGDGGGAGGGTGGSGVDDALVMFQTDKGSNEPDTTTWGAGDWTVRLNVTTANSNYTWSEVHICEFNGGSSAGTVASKTSLGIDIGSAGTKSTIVSQGSDYTPTDSTSTVYIVLVFNNEGGTWGMTPDQDIDTPISVTITLSAGTATATSNALASTLPGSLTLSAGTSTATANAPASTLDPGSLTLSAGTSTATANALATDLNYVLLTGVATATANALAETLSATGTVTLSAGTSTATANALAGSIPIVLNAGLPSATANALAETLSATGVVTLNANTATSTGAALPSDLSGTGVATISAGVSSASSTGLQAALNRTLHPNTASSTGNALDPSLDTTGTVTLSAGLVTATANVLTLDSFAVVLTPGAASATASGLNPDMFGVGAASDMKPGIASATSSGLRAKFIEKIVRLWTASPPTGVIHPQNVGRPELFDGARNKLAHSGAMQSRNRTQAGFQWTEEYGLLRMGDEGTEELMAIIEDIYSTENILKTTHPTTPGSGIDPNGTGTSGVTVNGASQKGDSIATTGWPVSTSDVVVAGDVIKIDGFDRVFRITSNADSDASGNATLDINPPIYESPVDGASVTTTEVEFEVNVVGVDNWPSVGDFYYDGLQVTFREQLDS